MSRSERDKAFGDAVYEAWRAGLDPDAVDPDAVDDAYDYHRNRFDAAGEVVRDMLRSERGRRP